jgi:hypothetical protein
VIAEATRRLLGGAFELKALGSRVLKVFGAAVSRISDQKYRLCRLDARVAKHQQ